MLLGGLETAPLGLIHAVTPAVAGGWHMHQEPQLSTMLIAWYNCTARLLHPLTEHKTWGWLRLPAQVLSCGQCVMKAKSALS